MQHCTAHSRADGTKEVQDRGGTPIQGQVQGRSPLRIKQAAQTPVCAQKSVGNLRQFAHLRMPFICYGVWDKSVHNLWQIAQLTPFMGDSLWHQFR